MNGMMAKRRKREGQEGYALVLVVFLLALAVIATATVAPNIIVNGRREKEEEMIWRGKQYVRGIRLFVRYWQMHGGATRFPTSMDDLTQNKVGIRFMRQAYKDPVNKKDGSWRFIYVGPNGQLIGSLKSRPLGDSSSGSSGGFGSLFGNNSQSSFGGGSASGGSSFGNSSFGGSSTSGNSSFGNSSFGNSSFGNGQNAAGAGANGNAAGAGATGQNGAQGSGATGSASDSFSSPMSTPQAIAGSDDNPTEVLGGNIIGVGSKVNEASIIWYDKAKNYRQFEFIWDPSKEPVNGGANAGAIGVPGQVPAGGSNGIFSSPGGQSGFGQTGTGGFGQSGTTGFGQQPGGTTTGTPGPGQNMPNQPTPTPGQSGPQPQ